MKTTTKLDLYKQHKDEYIAPKKPVLLTIKSAHYLAIAGKGAPGGSQFTACIGALYGAAYTIKMTRKFAGRQDYGVCKLEGLWFFDGNPAKIPQNQWRWKLLIRTPGFVTQKELKSAVATLRKRGKSPDAGDVKLEKLSEGRCVQMLHVGPYDRVGETIAIMRAFSEGRGFKLAGPHHEIYLSDPRRVPPERLRTIVREPVVKS